MLAEAAKVEVGLAAAAREGAVMASAVTVRVVVAMAKEGSEAEDMGEVALVAAAMQVAREAAAAAVAPRGLVGVLEAAAAKVGGRDRSVQSRR